MKTIDLVMILGAVAVAILVFLGIRSSNAAKNAVIYGDQIFQATGLADQGSMSLYDQLFESLGFTPPSQWTVK